MTKLEEITSYCKRRGLVFPTASIYGEYAGFFDYGPIGVELVNNIKNEWWKEFVHKREDVIGIDGSIITHPRVWEASGHVATFTDPLTECSKCHKRWRADHVIEDELNQQAEGLSNKELTKIMQKEGLKCPKCKGRLLPVSEFAQMFTTNVGPVENSTAFLRPETAQSIFVNYKPIMDSTRMQPPFGIAQIGKAFRNEISPRNFLFRLREFEQMEIEYLVLKKDLKKCHYYNKVKDLEINALLGGMEEKGIMKAEKMKISEALSKGLFTTEWHAYWTGVFYKWFINLGINPENLRVRQHLKDELSHYSKGTVDVEYHYPMGWMELQGVADRTSYDLKQHQEYSKENLNYYNQEDKKTELLYTAAEPSIGVDRLFLTLLFESLEQEKKRLVLKINPKLAPYKIAVFPLVNKKQIPDKAREVFKDLSNNFHCYYDDSGSIGRRYRRQDEIGTPYCITIDFDTLKDDTVTIRYRDSMEQERVKIKDLSNKIRQELNNA